MVVRGPLHTSIVQIGSQDRCPSPLLDARQDPLDLHPQQQQQHGQSRTKKPIIIRGVKKRLTKCVRFDGDDQMKAHRHLRNSKTSHGKSTRTNETTSVVVTVHEHIHYRDYTDEERTATWYNRSEIRAIKARNVQTVRLMASSREAKSSASSTFPSTAGTADMDDHDDRNGICMRGLEPRTARGHRVRRDCRFAVECAVLDEQEFQWDFGSGVADREVAIAQRSRSVTAASAHRAYDAGLEDEVAARMIYEQDETNRKEQQQQQDNNMEHNVHTGCRWNDNDGAVVVAVVVGVVDPILDPVVDPTIVTIETIKADEMPPSFSSCPFPAKTMTTTTLRTAHATTNGGGGGANSRRHHRRQSIEVGRPRTI